MKKIRITLFKDGTQRLEVLGASGDECLSFSRDLEERLGLPAGERTLKPEHEAAAKETDLEREDERGR